jgi:hypothetical protein
MHSANIRPPSTECSKTFVVRTLPAPARQDAQFREKAAASEWPRRYTPHFVRSVRLNKCRRTERYLQYSDVPTFVPDPQALSVARTMRKTFFSVRKIKNPQGLRQTLRIAPASSSSPVPQPSRERWSILRAGLLAHGSSYSPCLPIHRIGQWRWRVSSPFTAAGPRGIRTLFPYPEIMM